MRVVLLDKNTLLLVNLDLILQGKFEGRNATNFISIEVSPSVNSVNNNNINQVLLDANFDLVITGQNFTSGDNVDFIANDNDISRQQLQ